MDERYEIREKVGQGGLGTVYRSFDHRLGREVAIKRILTSEDDPTLKDEATKQLMVEAGALASLQHPNIVIVQDVGFDDEGPYVVMELINGKTLDEMIEDGPLDWPDCGQVAVQSLEALIAAQELNMIHSDLKPPNIMLTWLPSGSFQVKILDFGLAVLIHNQSHEEIEKMESMFGSFFFMPPEQFERKVLDARSDLYSLGCCFYQALTGTYPFRGESGEEVMASHLHHTVIPIGELRDDIPVWACQWVMWLINRNPEDRPGSAREALANFIQNEIHAESELSESEAEAMDTSHEPAVDENLVGGEGDEVAPGPEVRWKAILSKISKTHLKIAAAAALLLLMIGGLLFVANQRNERVRRERTYHNLVTSAADDKVKEIQMSGTDLQIILDFIGNSEPKAYLKDTYRALVLAKASDSTNIGKTIADFATTADLPSPIRRNLFEEVIEERGDEAAVPALIRFSASAKSPDEAVSAMDAISHMTRDDHAEELLGVLSSASQPEVRESAEELLESIIHNSKNQAALAQLISNKRKPDGTPSLNQALDRLIQIAKPQSKPSPTPKPTPRPNPQPRPSSEPPKEFKAFVEALNANDDSKKIEAVTALGDSSNPSAHAILMEFAKKSENADLKPIALKAVTKLNSSPRLVENGDQARQRWVQITWISKTPEEEKLLIDVVSTIDADWAPSILERMIQYSKNTATKELGKQALEAMAKGGKPE